MGQATRPTLLLCLSAAVFVVVWLYGRSRVLDVQLHDTYYVVGMNQIAWVLIIVHLLTGLVYWTIRKLALNQLAVRLHLALSIVSAGLIITLSYCMSIPPQANADSAPLDLINQIRWQGLLVITIIIWIASHSLLMINLVWTLLFKR